MATVAEVSRSPASTRLPRFARRTGIAGRHHPLTWTVVLLHVVAALAFSVLLPMFRSPDEATHVDLIRQHARGLGHDRPDRTVPLGLDVKLAQDSVSPLDVRPRRPQLAEDAVPRPERPAFHDIAPPGEPSDIDNHMTQHPPLYYASVAAASTFVGGLTPTGWWSWDREMYLYRLLSILLTAPLPLLAAEGALAVGLTRRVSAIAAASLLLVPQATAIGAAVNNDALVLLGSAGAVAASLWHLRTGSGRSGSVAALAATVAALTKATAAPLLAWVVVVVVIRWWHDRRHAPLRATDASRPSAADLGGPLLTAAAGLSWYVVNLVRFRDPQPTGLRPLRQAENFTPSPLGFLHQWLDRLSRTFWGMPARRTGVALPWAVPHALSLTAAVLVVAAWWDRTRRRATAMLWLLCAAQVALLLRSNWGSHSRSGALPAVQGRYLYALLVPVAVLGVVGARQLARWAGTRVPLPSASVVGFAVAAVGMVLHVLLGLSMLQGFWGAPDASTAERLRALVAWSPLPAAATWALLGAAAGAAVGSVGALAARIRAAGRGPRPATTSA